MRTSKAMGIVLLCGLSLTAAVACKTDKSNPSANTETLAPLPQRQETGNPTPATPAAPAQKNSCYQDLCQFSPENPDLKSVIEKAEKPSEKQKAYFDQHIAPVLNSLMSAKMQDDQIVIERLQKIEEAGLPYNLSEEKMNLFKMVAVLNGRIFSLEQRQKLMSVAKDKAFFKAYGLVQIKGAESYFSALYPKDSLAEALKQESEIILKNLVDLNKRMKTEFISVDETPMLLAKEKKTITLEQIDNISKVSFALRLIPTLLDAKDILKSLPLDNNAIKDYYRSSNILNKLRLRLAATPQMTQKCEVAFYRAINLLPSEKEIENFKKIESQVKEAVIELLPAGDLSLEKIRASKTYYPNTPEKGIQNWINGLQIETGATRNSLEKAKSISDEDTYFVGALDSLSNSENRNFCNQIIDMSISDSTLTTESVIKMSWASVKYPQYGAMIYAHELGHTVQEHSKSFERKQQCLIDKKSTNQFIGDDFADVIAAEAMEAYQKKTNNPVMNMACFFNSADSAKTLKEEFKEEGVHSTGLYRILQVAQGQKQEIPQSCVEQAQREQPKALEVCN